MDKFIRIGVDLGKNYFRIHALRIEGGSAVSRKLSGRRCQLLLPGSRLAGSAWRLAARRIIGRASLSRWGTRWC